MNERLNQEKINGTEIDQFVWFIRTKTSCGDEVHTTCLYFNLKNGRNGFRQNSLELILGNSWVLSAMGCYDVTPSFSIENDKNLLIPRFVLRKTAVSYRK